MKEKILIEIDRFNFSGEFLQNINFETDSQKDPFILRFSLESEYKILQNSIYTIKIEYPDGKIYKKLIRNSL